MDEDINTIGFRTEDLLTLFFVYVGTNASIGFMIGWGVSLLAKCGRFDTQMYIDQMLRADNCTNPPDTSYCYETQRIASREAVDQSLRMCFYYCGWGTLWGVVFAFATLGLACSVWQKKRLRICADLICERINQWFLRFIERVWNRSFLRRPVILLGQENLNNINYANDDQNSYQPPMYHPKSPLTPRPLESLDVSDYNVSNEQHHPFPLPFPLPPEHNTPAYKYYSPPPLNYIPTHKDVSSQGMQYYTGTGINTHTFIPLSPASPLTPRGL
jgi:hypothetical protein